MISGSLKAWDKHSENIGVTARGREQNPAWKLRTGEAFRKGASGNLLWGFGEHLNQLSFSLLSSFLPYPRAPGDNNARTPCLALGEMLWN